MPLRLWAMRRTPTGGPPEVAPPRARRLLLPARMLQRGAGLGRSGRRPRTAPGGVHRPTKDAGLPSPDAWCCLQERCLSWHKPWLIGARKSRAGPSTSRFAGYPELTAILALVDLR